MDSKREYACLFSENDQYYLIDCELEKISFKVTDITSLLLIFDRYRYILTIDGYTEFFRKLYYVNPEIQPYLVVENNCFYLKLRNNVVDLSLYANAYNQTKWFTRMMDAYRHDQPYGGDIIEYLNIITEMASIHHVYRKEGYLHRMLLHPKEFCKSLFINQEITIDLPNQTKQKPMDSVIWKRIPIIDSNVVVWYTYPIKYNLLPTKDRFEKYMGDALPDVVEQIIKFALEAVPDTSPYVKMLGQLPCLMDELVSVSRDYIISVEVESNFRATADNVYGINMYVKKIYKHFWYVTASSWVGIDENDQVDMHGFPSSYVNPYMKKCLYESILYKRYPQVEYPTYHTIFNPHFQNRNDWKVAKLGYTIVPFNAEEYAKYNRFYDTNFFLLPEYADSKNFYYRIHNAFQTICQQAGINFITLKRNLRYEYVIQCETCYKVQTLLEELNPNEECNHSFGDNFMLVNGHFSFGYYSMHNDIDQACDHCKCLYQLKDESCYYNFYKEFDKPKINGDGVIVRGTYLDDQSRVCLERKNVPHQLISTLVLRQGKLIPLLLVSNKTIDYFAMLLLEGFIPDQYFNIYKMVPKTIIHCEGYGFFFIKNETEWLLTKNPVDIIHMM